jgi:hypothetical protein
MTRYELGRRVEERLLFTGEFANYGTKPGYAKRPVTILLVQIRHNNRFVTDHLWFNRTKGFEAVGLRKGDQVQFEARIRTYRKSNGRLDYKLSYPTKISRLGRS